MATYKFYLPIITRDFERIKELERIQLKYLIFSLKPIEIYANYTDNSFVLRLITYHYQGTITAININLITQSIQI